MGKKTKEKMEVPAMAPYTPPTCIRLTKDQAGKVSIGDKVSITVEGEVKGIRSIMGYSGDSETIEGYEVELLKSSVKSISGNPAEKALKNMKKGSNG